MQRLTLKFIHHFQSPKFIHHLLYSNSSFSTDSFANYLIDSLGFSHQQALSASNKLSKYRKVNDFNFEANANSVVTFFKNYGFNDTHLRKMVSFYPRFLTANVDNTIKPRLMFLEDQGFSGSDLIRLISVNPTLLLSGSDSSILSAVEDLRKILVCDANVVAVLEKLRWNSLGDITRYLMTNTELLISYGIPIDIIRKHLALHPTSYLRNNEKFKEMANSVENKIGISRDSSMFLYGIHLLNGYSEETTESKCRMFKSFGWTQSDVETLMIKNAICFTISEESIKKKLDFFMNELRLKPAYMISNSSLLTYSLEKRLVPRHKVLVILKEQGLLEKYPSLSTIFCMPEPCFLKRFVIPFNEVHQIYTEHTGCNMKMLTQEGADNLS